jgi:hypothetical protein
VQRHNYLPLPYSVLAIVFLGGPNPKDDSPASVDCIQAMLLVGNSKLSRRALTAVKEDIHTIVNVSQLFADMQLDVDMLSLVESAPTKVKLGRKESKFSLSTSTKIKVSTEVRYVRWELTSLLACT